MVESYRVTDRFAAPASAISDAGVPFATVVPAAVDVYISATRKATEAPAVGADLRIIWTEYESVDAVSNPTTETVAAVVVSRLAPFVTEAEPTAVVSVGTPAAADDGATERTPRPSAATATSAMRLNVVFVDICFLSIVDLRNFRRSAWNQFPNSSRFIARADESKWVYD